jgi:hypothetical protein
VADAVSRFGAAGWLDRPRSYHDDPGSPDSPVVGRRRVGRTTFETLRFDSVWVPHADEPGRTRWLGYERNVRARVLMLRNRGAPRAMRDDARFDRLMAQGDALFRVVSPLAVVPATPPERCYLYGGWSTGWPTRSSRSPNWPGTGVSPACSGTRVAT